MDQNFKLFVLLQWLFALSASMEQTADPYADYFIRNSSDFKEITEGLFVDKTLLIKEVINGFNLVTCPPGFGKTTNLNMLQRFFEISVNNKTGQVLNVTQTENYKLFKNVSLELKIAKDEEFFETHFGKYPVILLDLTIRNGTNFQTVLDGVRKQLSKCFQRYEWLFEGVFREQLTEDDRQVYQYIVKESEMSSENVSDCVYRSLHFLAHVLNQYFKVKPILLVDEFDSPMRRTIQYNGNVKETHALVDNLFYNVFHANPPIIEFGFVNGVFTMLRGSTTARTMITSHVFLKEHRFVDYYGFTEDEVQNRYFKPLLIEREEVTKLRRYYQGYIRDRVSYVNIYAPVDIVGYFYNRIELHCVDLDNYMTRGPIFANFDNIVHDNYIREVLVDLMWFRPLTFPVITSLAVDHIQKLCRVMNEQKSSNRIGGELLLPYLYEHGLMSPGPSMSSYKAPNDEIRLFFKKYVGRYYFYNRPVDLVNSMQKLCNVMSKIIDSMSNIISPEELADLELYTSTFFRTFENLSVKIYGIRATETDLRVMFYFVSWRVSKLAKWKYQAVLQLNSGFLKKRKVDMMMTSHSDIMLLIRVRYTSIIHPEYDNIGQYQPLGKKPKQLKYLDLLVGENLTVKALSAPSRNYTEYEQRIGRKGRESEH